MMKLHNEIKTVEIGGQPVRVGRLTVGAAIEIEAFLETLQSPLQLMEEGVLKRFLPEQTAAEVADILLQRSGEWPPDALDALGKSKMLFNGSFAQVFVRAIVSTYNSHMSPDEIAKIAASASIPGDLVILQRAALGVTSDPKDESVVDAASESTGDATLQS